MQYKKKSFKVQDRSWSAVRIRLAVESIEELWHESKGVQLDAVNDVMTINAWLFIPSLYSVIEQSFKWILREGERTHQLSDLFQEIDNETQTALREGYREYCNVHKNLGEAYPSLDQFLNALDEHGGYTAQRYFLLDGYGEKTKDGKVSFPVQSIEGMLEIAVLCKQITYCGDTENRYSRVEFFITRMSHVLIELLNLIAGHRIWIDNEGKGEQECTDRAEFIIDTFNKGILVIADSLREGRLIFRQDIAPSLEFNEDSQKCLQEIVIRCMKYRYDIIQFLNYMDEARLQFKYREQFDDDKTLTCSWTLEKRASSVELSGGVVPTKKYAIGSCRFLNLHKVDWGIFDTAKLSPLTEGWYFGFAYDKRTKTNYGFAIKNGFREGLGHGVYLLCADISVPTIESGCKMHHWPQFIDGMVYSEIVGSLDSDIDYREIKIVKEALLLRASAVIPIKTPCGPLKQFMSEPAYKREPTMSG